MAASSGYFLNSSPVHPFYCHPRLCSDSSHRHSMCPLDRAGERLVCEKAKSIVADAPIYCEARPSSHWRIRRSSTVAAESSSIAKYNFATLDHNHKIQANLSLSLSLIVSFCSSTRPPESSPFPLGSPPPFYCTISLRASYCALAAKGQQCFQDSRPLLDSLE